MSLRFNWQDLPNRLRGLTFDDVLIVPQLSKIKSRKDPDLSTQLTKSIKLNIPIISANMDTITESQMAIAMHELGGLGILHRFMKPDRQAREVSKVKDAGVPHIGASVGTNSEERQRAKILFEAGARLLTIDVAHGHTYTMIDQIKFLKDSFPGIEVIAGNVATPEGTRDLIDAGADSIKVGIGPGSMCTTRVITGCGVPQLTAISLCATVAMESGVPIIADGGVRTSGDVVKALSSGAQTVMLGSMLAGTLETPGEIHMGKKAYRGMASRKAQKSWRGELPEGMAPEGESTRISVKGPVKEVILEICGGIRSGMSYINADTIEEMRQNVVFIEMSQAGTVESHAHGLNYN